MPVATFFLALAISARANAVPSDLITFDYTTPGYILTDYQAPGTNVTISGNGATESGAGPDGSTALLFGQVVSETFSFSVLASSFSLDIAKVAGTGAAEGLLCAFLDGAPVGTAPVSLPEGGPFAALSFGGAGFDQVLITISTDNARFVIDNVAVDYATPVPEPATLALLVSGLAAVAAFRAKPASAAAAARHAGPGFRSSPH